MPDSTTTQPPVTNVSIGEGAANPYQPHTGSSAGGTTTQGPTTAASGTPSIGTPDRSQGGLFTVTQETQAAADEVQNARLAVAATSKRITDQQDLVNRLNQDPTAAATGQLAQATSTLNTLYNNLATDTTRLQTANVSYSNVLTDAIKSNQVDPAQVDLANANVAKANADADVAQRQVKVLEDGAEGQRALVAAQAGSANASAAAQEANARATDATTRGDSAQGKELTAQANALNAQAQQTNLLIGTADAPGPLIQKANEEVKTQAATTDQIGAQADLDRASATQATAQGQLASAQAEATRQATAAGQPAANVALTQAQAGQAQGGGINQLAQAAGTLSTIQQAQLGPLYGFAERQQALKSAIGAIQQQVFGPGGSGNVDEANALLGQVQDAFDAQLAGTTPYAASVAAANAGLTQFGTQASLANAAQSALASRAAALGQVGSAALTSLLGVMKDAPKGSQALGPAFQDVIDMMANKMNTGALAPPPQPTAPNLPPLIQRLAGVGGAQGAPAGGNAQWWAGQAPPPAAGGAQGAGAQGGTGQQVMSNPPGPSTQTAAPQTLHPQALPMPSGGGTVGGQTGPNMNVGGTPAPGTPGAAGGQQGGVTINIGGSSQNPANSGISYSGAPAGGVWPMADWSPSGSPAAPQQSSLPGVLAQHAPATAADVHNIWANELSSGAVSSPMGINPNGSAAGPVGAQSTGVNVNAQTGVAQPSLPTGVLPTGAAQYPSSPTGLANAGSWVTGAPSAPPVPMGPNPYT